MKKIISLALTLCMVLALFCTCANAEEPSAEVEPLHLVVAHCNPESHPYHIGLEAFKEYVETESNGAITVEVHASDLGTADDELIQKTMLGAIDMICASPAYLTNIGVPEVEFFSLMFLFDSMDHWADTLFGETGNEIADIINEKIGGDAVLVGYFSAGCRSYYGGKPMETMADFSGTKVRIQNSAVQRKVWEAAGAVPVVVAWGELYQALQQGVVDGAENDFSSCVSKDQHRTANGKYMTLTEHDYGTRPLFFNGAKWNNLTEAQKAIIDKGIDICEEAELQAMLDMTDEYRERYISEGGGGVSEFAERDAFKALGIPVQDDLCKELGMTSILEEVRALSK